MDDEWPARNDLTLDEFHFIWKFFPDHSIPDLPDLAHLLLKSESESECLSFTWILFTVEFGKVESQLFVC